MKCSTEAVRRMAEIVVQEMEQAGMAGKDLRSVETEIREMMREVGAVALGQYLEEQDEELRGQKEVCGCGREMQALFKREARIVSVFGRVSYRRWYHRCTSCHVGQAPLDGRLGIEAGQVTAGLAELLALAGIEIAVSGGKSAFVSKTSSPCETCRGTERSTGAGDQLYL